jgi:TetR/AcrR family transcriptional regulator, transcriptional repressor for nem operon
VVIVDIVVGSDHLHEGEHSVKKMGRHIANYQINPLIRKRDRLKEDLAAKAMAHALEHGAELQSRYTNVLILLSESHLADRANGCALAALGGDVARRSERVRTGATPYVRTQLERLAGLFRGTAAARRRRAITTLAGIVGALPLARPVEDPVLSDEILSTARHVFGSSRPAA